MKIALLAPPWIPIPPKGYGGIELVVGNLVEGLVKKGHDVTLFATGDSKTSARLEYLYPHALGNDLFIKNNHYFMLDHINSFFRLVLKEKFDILHNNAQYLPMFFFDLQTTPFIHTMHGAYYKDLVTPSGYIREVRNVLMKFKHHPFVSISDNQRTGLPELNYVGTVYNSIDSRLFTTGDGTGNYLAWLGRITPYKGLDTAIRVAKKAGMKLKIVSFIDKGDQSYFDTVIVPLLDENTEFHGEIRDTQEKIRFLGSAIATLFPIKWHEPFGIVMVESMASGTPVIAFPMGSVPEVVEDGKTGFLVNSEEEMVEAVKKASSLDRSYIHNYAINRFNNDLLVSGYEEVYQQVLKTHGG